VQSILFAEYITDIHRFCMAERTSMNISGAVDVQTMTSGVAPRSSLMITIVQYRLDNLYMAGSLLISIKKILKHIDVFFFEQKHL
jgi:hypothetical protein